MEALVLEVDSRKNQLKVQVGKDIGQIGRKSLAWAQRGRRLTRVFEPGDVILVKALEVNEDTGEWNFGLEPDPEAQAAFVCLENDTGNVKACIGGRDFSQSQFNRAVQAKRQPGSAFKPFVYSAAIDNGFTQASVINDYPVQYKTPDGVWSPRNYGRGYSGPTTLYSALVRSVNVVAVKVLDMVGAETVIKYAHQMGIKSELGPNLSLALGSSEVTLLEMVGAFTTFPNLGERVVPKFINRIEDRYGNPVTEFQTQRIRALSPETAYIVLDMLRGVVQYGTARRVSVLGRPVGGKTGTTNSLADAWFVGFTPDYAAGAWVGMDQRVSLGHGEQGGRTAAPIFVEFMKEFLKDKPKNDFKVPLGVTRAGISVGSVDEEGVEHTSYHYMVFKKGQIGRGRSEEPVIEPATPDNEPYDDGDTMEERMKKHIDRYKSKVTAAHTD